jgi:hypothetical protein
VLSPAGSAGPVRRRRIACHRPGVRRHTDQHDVLIERVTGIEQGGTGIGPFSDSRNSYATLLFRRAPLVDHDRVCGCSLMEGHRMALRPESHAAFTARDKRCRRWIHHLPIRPWSDTSRCMRIPRASLGDQASPTTGRQCTSYGVPSALDRGLGSESSSSTRQAAISEEKSALRTLQSCCPWRSFPVHSSLVSVLDDPCGRNGQHSISGM